MIKTSFLALFTAAALVIGGASPNTLTGVTQSALVPTNNPVPSAQAPATQPEDELKLGMELLWCAPVGTYDTTNVEDLVPHTPEVLEPGNVYEVAIKVANDTDEAVAAPWGVDYAIVLPRTIMPLLLNGAVEGAVHSSRRNGDAGMVAELSVGLEASEPVALRYVDFSNYVIDSGEAARAGFKWTSDSNPLDDEKIFLQGVWQGFQPHTYKIVSFEVEVCPFAEWEEFADIMHTQPVRSRISNIVEGARWEKDGFYDIMYRKEVLDIDLIVNIPQWLRELVSREGGYWRIMVQPLFGEHGTVAAEIRFENHGCAYVLAADQAFPEDFDSGKWLKGGWFKGAIFEGCDTYATAENWDGYGANCCWASLKETNWGDLLEQDKIHITLEVEMK